MGTTDSRDAGMAPDDTDVAPVDTGPAHVDACRAQVAGGNAPSPGPAVAVVPVAAAAFDTDAGAKEWKATRDRARRARSAADRESAVVARKKTKRVWLHGKADTCAELQARTYNEAGFARTRDWELPITHDLRPAVRGFRGNTFLHTLTREPGRWCVEDLDRGRHLPSGLRPTRKSRPCGVEV